MELKAKSAIFILGIVRKVGGKYWLLATEIQGFDPVTQGKVNQDLAEIVKKAGDAAAKEKFDAAQKEKDKTKAAAEKLARDAQAKKEGDARREQKLAMEAKQAALNADLKPLEEARKELIQNFPFPGQGGKSVGQVLAELDSTLKSATFAFQRDQIRDQIRQVKDIQASLGPAKAAQTITEVEAKIADVEAAAINPTLPNWSNQNGRITFKSVATKNMIKAGLQKDIVALKKYKDGIEDLNMQIAEVYKKHGVSR